MERARERVYYSDEGAAAAAGNAGDGGERKDSVVEGIRSLIRATWEDVKEWCDEEAEARVRRKDSQVRKSGHHTTSTPATTNAYSWTARTRYLNGVMATPHHEETMKHAFHTTSGFA